MSAWPGNSASFQQTTGLSFSGVMACVGSGSGAGVVGAGVGNCGCGVDVLLVLVEQPTVPLTVVVLQGGSLAAGPLQLPKLGLSLFWQLSGFLGSRKSGFCVVFPAAPHDVEQGPEQKKPVQKLPQLDWHAGEGAADEKVRDLSDPDPGRRQTSAAPSSWRLKFGAWELIHGDA